MYGTPTGLTLISQRNSQPSYILTYDQDSTLRIAASDRERERITTHDHTCFSSSISDHPATKSLILSLLDGLLQVTVILNELPHDQLSLSGSCTGQCMSLADTNWANRQQPTWWPCQVSEPVVIV